VRYVTFDQRHVVQTRRMNRRRWSALLLIILAAQLVGGMVWASACPEPCPDDTSTTSCPPICTSCATCTHAQTAIVQLATDGTPLMDAREFVAQSAPSFTSQRSADIFHVPLLG